MSRALTRSGLAALLLALLLALLAGPALAVGSEPSSLDGDAGYQRAVALIKAGDCAGAIPALEAVRKARGEEADVYNWLGYCHRMTRNWAQARVYYDRALALDARHKGANEYLGELLAEQGDLAGARTRLEVLRSVCGTACAEYRQLNAAIEKAGAKR